MSSYTIVYRSVKGSPLTNSELDNNFQNLDTYKAPADSPSFTTLVNSAGPVTVNAGTGSLVLTNGSGTGATSMILKRVGAATDQKQWEAMQYSDGSFQVRTANDAYSSFQTVLQANRGTGYTVTTLQLMPAGGRTLVGVVTDDGVSALQVSGNANISGQLLLSSSVSSIELGSLTTAGAPYIDFHTSGNNIAYDSRIIGSSGTGSVGNGNLNYYASTHIFNNSGVVPTILVGITTTDAAGGMLQVGGDIHATQGKLTTSRYGNSGALRLRSTAGTFLSPAATPTATQVSTIIGTSYDGATFHDVTAIDSWSEAAVTSTSAPANLRFFTTQTGAVVPTERMRITGSGRTLIGTTSDDGVTMLQVAGPISTTNTATATAGAVLTGTSGYSAGVQLSNNTASVGKKFSIYSNTSGNLSFDDTTAGAVRMTITSAGRHIVGAGSDDGVNTLQVGGTVTASSFSGTALDAGGAQFRAVSTSYGAFIRNDNANVYFMQTASGSPLGTYNAYRPLSWNLSTGVVAIDGTGAGTTFGKRPTFNGQTPYDTGNFNPANYLPLTGGSLSGPVVVAGAITSTSGSMGIQGWGGNTAAGVLYFGPGSNSHYIYYDGSNMNVSTSGNLVINGYQTWHTGNLPSPVSTTGATFTGAVGLQGSLYFYNNANAIFYGQGNTYACFLRADSSGIVGFLNGADSAWNFTVSDGGNTTVRGFQQINGATYINTAYGYLASNGTTGPSSGNNPYSLYCPNGRILAQEIDANSDRRLKYDIETLTVDRALSFVSKARAVTHKWKNNPEGSKRFGFIAQEISKAGFDELIGVAPDEDIVETIDEDGFVSPAGARFTMNYDQAVPLLTVALNNALERIAALEALIAGKA
jgi:hypothetical protein